MTFPKIPFGIVVFLCLGCLLFFGARFFAAYSVPTFIPKKSQQILTPPTNAITGQVIDVEGGVKQLVRDATEYTEATPGGQIRQGEALATAQGTATITLPSLGKITLGEHAEVSLVNLIPRSLLFQQKSGPVTYEVSEPISLRVLHSLFTGKGTITISLEDGITTATVQDGSLTLGIIDTTNTTHTYTISGKETLIVNDADRSVRIR